MKNIILLLSFLFLSLLGNSQHSAENKALKLDYVNWYHNKYYIVINNYQSCPVPMRIKWENKDTILLSGLIEVVQLPSKAFSDCSIRVRSLGWCRTTTPQRMDSTWVEIRPVYKQYVKN